MSGINPAVLGIGTGVAVGLGAGFGLAKITDNIGTKYPDGSKADGKARAVLFSAAGAGVLGGVGGGMIALAKGNLKLGAALIGGGIGTVAGVFGAGFAFDKRHGIGVDTKTSDVFVAYNRDFDDELDLDTRWRTPENVRRVEHRHEDSDGRVHRTYSYYTIDRLTSKADTDRDMKVTVPELRAAIDSYDADGNGRVQGDEAKRMEREVGEERWYGGWYTY